MEKNIEILRNTVNNLEADIMPVRNQIREIQARIKAIEQEQEAVILSAPENQDFINLCNEVGAEGIQADHRTEPAVFEDDGALFISNGQVVAFFICNQEITKSEWNRQARPIVRAFNQFGITWSMFNR